MQRHCSRAPGLPVLPVLITLVLATAAAAPLAAPLPTGGARAGGGSKPLSAADAHAYAGIARFDANLICTGVFLQPSEAEPPADAPAYLLTAGHCVKLFEPDEVWTDAPARGSRATFEFFAGVSGRPHYRARRIAWASMTGRDLAVVELDATYGELKAKGLTPWRIAPRRATPGETIVIVGAPMDDLLRATVCSVGAPARAVREHHWRWFEMDTNECAGIRDGFSGGPVLELRSGTVLGLVTTSTRESRGLTDCAFDRPCEVRGRRRIVRENTNYVVPLTGLGACFDERGRFDRIRRGCPLGATETSLPGA